MRLHLKSCENTTFKGLLHPTVKMLSITNEAFTGLEWHGGKWLIGVLQSGFLRLITDCRSQKTVSADPITDTDLFKAIFLSCRIIYSDPQISIFLFFYSVPEFHFWKWGGIPLLGHSCGFFYLRGGGGHFLDIFQKYKFISPKCFIIQCIFVITIVQLLQKSLHAAQAWFHTGVHYWSILFTTNNIYPFFWFQIQTLLLKMFFHCESFYFTVIQSL